MNRFFLGFMILTAILFTGCEKKYARGRIHGKITYQGIPVTNTTLIFLGVDNMAYRAELNEQGTYSLDGVPIGPLKVSLQQAVPRVPKKADPDLNAKEGGEKKDASLPPPSIAIKPSFQLPPSYANPEQSGLSFEFKQSNQEWSIDLK